MTSFLADADIIAHALEAYYQESLAATEPVLHQVPLEQLVTDLQLAEYLESVNGAR